MFVPIALFIPLLAAALPAAEADQGAAGDGARAAPPIATSPLPAPPPPPVPPPRRVVAPFPPSWPPLRNLEVRSGPDWTDYRIYPAKARRMNQEGIVIVADLVGPKGVPKECRVLESSGHRELDAGTCELFMKMRFAPPRDSRGRPTEAWFARRLVWVLADEPNPLEPGSMAAHLQFRNGGMTSCALTGSGPYLSHWSKTTCLTLGGTLDYYFGPNLPTSGDATVFVDLVPQGSAAPNHGTPSRRLIASRRTTFELDEDGNPSNCRSPVDNGFGRPREDHASACGYFLGAVWFEKPRKQGKGDAPAEPRRGAVEVKVYVGK